MPLYQSIARLIEHQIDLNQYRVGDKLPSIRVQSGLQNVSAGTIVQAYQYLEDRGVIEGKAKSGYYVASPSHPPIPLTEPHFTSDRPIPVNVGELAREVTNNASDPNVIALGKAEPNLTSPAIKRLHQQLAKAAKLNSIKGAQSAPCSGLAELRQQAAQLVSKRGVSTTSDGICITNGCQEALLLALQAVAQPGDTIAIESPCYYGSLQLIEQLNMQVLEIPSDPHNGISLRALQMAVKRWPIKACMLTPSFSNPLGSCIPPDQRQAIVNLANEYDFALIEDDIFGALGYQHHNPLALKHYDTEDRVLYCTSFSKVLDPTLRLGWIVGGRYHERVEYLKFITNINGSDLIQRGVSRFLQDSSLSRHLRSVCRQYEHNLQQLNHLIAKYLPEGCKASSPRGGFLLWLELPTGYDGMQLYRDALLEGIGIAPGELFSPTRDYQNCVRLNYANLHLLDAEFLIARLAHLLSKQNQT